ncbi:hypothetical protein [uncultured Jatrophihabitans sp.]|uniref:hypothetical protein n=1 Tax=uncultured Jatrophihabitans sp. TaxID=1610747 RepID=UPI0035CA0D54
MTAYVVSTGTGLVFAAPDRTAAQLRTDVEAWVRDKRMMTVAGVDAAGDEASMVVAWDDVTDYSITEDEPAGGTIVMTYVGED